MTVRVFDGMASQLVAKLDVLDVSGGLVQVVDIRADTGVFIVGVVGEETHTVVARGHDGSVIRDGKGRELRDVFDPPEDDFPFEALKRFHLNTEESALTFFVEHADGEFYASTKEGERKVDEPELIEHLRRHNKEWPRRVGGQCIELYDKAVEKTGSPVLQGPITKETSSWSSQAFRGVYGHVRYHALQLRYSAQKGPPMPSKSTSFRISERAKRLLSRQAEKERISATALLERLILEGVEAMDHPGIIYRGPGHDRRAALASGPDVWEVIARLRELSGSEEERTAELAKETDLHPRLIRLAIDFAADHPKDIEARIKHNEAAAEASRRASQRRNSLLA